MRKIEDYYDEDNKPIKCQFCESTRFRSIVKSDCGYTTCEEEIRCKNCDKVISYWTYGYYDPGFKQFANNTKENIMEKGKIFELTMEEIEEIFNKWKEDWDNRENRKTTFSIKDENYGKLAAETFIDYIDIIK